MSAEQAGGGAGRQLHLGQRRQQHLDKHEKGLSAHLQVSFLLSVLPLHVKFLHIYVNLRFKHLILN